MKYALVVAGIAVAAASDLAMRPAPVWADKFNIGVNIGVPAPPPPPQIALIPPPPPPIALVTPPPLVVVPGTPVYYAPGLSLNFFAYGGRYYSHHNGAWFVAANSTGPWTFIAANRIPRPVLAVPVSYYKVPPGHRKKIGGPPHRGGHGKGRGHKWKDD